MSVWDTVTPKTSEAKSVWDTVTPTPPVDFKHHVLREQVLRNQGAPTLKKKPTVWDKVKDEVGGVGEFIGNTATTIGALPMDAGHFAGAAVDSIVQEDLSRENFNRNMERRAESTKGLRDALVMQPTTERGKAMTGLVEQGLAAPGQITHDAIMQWGKSIGADTSPYLNQLAGVGSVAADIAPFMLMEKGVQAAKPTPKRYVNSPGLEGVREVLNGEMIREDIGTNTFAGQPAVNPVITQAMRDTRDPMGQHARVMEEAQTRLEKQRESQTRNSAVPTEVQPSLLEVPEAKAPEVTPEQWNQEFAQERVDRQTGMREAIANDEAAMAREMAAGHENPLITNVLGERSRDLQNLHEQQPGIFNHDVTDGIPAKNNLEVAPEVKPVIKATAEEFVDMRKNGDVSPQTHFSFFPDGPGPGKPVYLINKEGLASKGLTLEQLKKDLAEGKESEHLGYPERSPRPEENKTAAVTKDDRILTNPDEIKEAQTQGELKWAAEGRPEEVLAKAEEVANNGSGESAASLEAQSRLKSEQGDKFYRVENGVVRNELPPTVDRVDTFPTKPTEAIIRVKPDGTMEKVSGEGKMPNEVPVPKEVKEEKVGEYDLSEDMKDSDGVPVEEPKATPDSTAIALNEIETAPESTIVDMNLGVNPEKAAEAAIDIMKDQLDKNSSYAIRNFFRGFRNPQFLAENFPIIKRVYDLMGSRREMRNAILYDLFNVGIKKGQQIYRKMKDKADLDKLVELSDIYEISHDPHSLLTDNNLLGKPVSKEVIAAYELIKEQRLANVKRDAYERRELALSQFEDRPWYQDLREVFIEKTIDLEENPYYFEDKGLAFNEQFQKDLAKASERMDKIAEVEQAYLDKPFYAPRVREAGDWAVRVYPIINGEIKKDFDVYMKMAKTPKQAAKLKAEIEANPEKHFPINHRDTVKTHPNVKWKVEITESKNLPEDVYLFAGKPTASLSKLQFALERARDKGKIDAETYDAIFEEVMNSYEEATLMRGYGRHNIARNERLIEGYDNKNYFKIFKDQTSGLAGSLSKAKFMLESLKAMKDAPIEAKPFVQEMITNALRNKNSRVDAWSATVRSAITLYHLGFRTISFLANSLQNYSLGAAEMNLRLRRDYKLGSTATPDILSAQARIVSGKGISAESRAFLDWFDRVGADQAQFVNEVSTAGEKGALQFVNTATGYAMKVFGIIESKFNREALGLAMYERLRKNGVSVEEARQVAKDTSNIAHGDMSPENLPLHAQKIESMARPALALRRYNLHVFNYIFNRLGQKEFRPVARLLVAQTALGGLKAIPLFLAINEVMERKFGKSPLLAVKKAIYGMMKDSNQTLAEVIDRVVERGLPSLVGIDMSNNLSLSMPFLFEEGEKTFGESVGGVLVSDVKNVGKAIDKAESGQPGKAALQVAPAMIRDVGKGILGMTEGYEDKKGNPLEDSEGNPIILSPGEAALQMMGATPVRVGETRDMRSSEYRLEEFYRNKMMKFNLRLQNASDKEYDAIMDVRNKFIEGFKEKYPDLISSSGIYKPRLFDRKLMNRQNFEQGLTNAISD